MPNKPTHYAILLLILLIAFVLRVASLTDVPPGLTHDEANHGREAIGILDGNLAFYFPLNYGSEPLYSYSVAGSMALLGENLFALRFVGAIFGVLTIALLYSWVRRWFGDPRLALWASGLTAVSYWALVGSRMALRATLLPFFMLAAAYFFWRIIGQRPRQLWNIVGLGVAIALTLHVYLAARVLWVIFPAFVIYLALVKRPLFKQVWRPLALSLLLTGLLVIPMFVYLESNPEAQTRLEMLDGNLNEARQGNLQPLVNNAKRALFAFAIPSYGDQFLAYNLPGKPVFAPVTAVLFVIGLLTCLWFWKRPRYLFVLLWFGAGIAPSLITGPTANTTRNIGALPVIYLLPVIGFVTISTFLQGRFKLSPKWVQVAAVLWLAGVGLLTVRDYFGRWATEPDVRAAYQTTIIAALDYAETELPPERPTIVSSVYPGSAHDTSIAMVVLNDKEKVLRWVDARRALMIVGTGPQNLLVPASTPLHPHFQQWVEPIETIPMRPDDLDSSFSAYTLNPPAVPAEAMANFNGAVELLSAEWLAEQVPAGGVAELLTVWRVIDPEKIGARVPPAYTTEMILFTHVLRPDGTILTQADQLDAPSWGWQTGDLFMQIQQMYVPPETAADSYPAIVGFYEEQSGIRPSLLNGTDTFAPLPPLTISP